MVGVASLVGVALAGGPRCRFNLKPEPPFALPGCRLSSAAQFFGPGAQEGAQRRAACFRRQCLQVGLGHLGQLRVAWAVVAYGTGLSAVALPVSETCVFVLLARATWRAPSTLHNRTICHSPEELQYILVSTETPVACGRVWVGFPRVHHLHVPMWFGLWSTLLRTSHTSSVTKKTLSSNE